MAVRGHAAITMLPFSPVLKSLHSIKLINLLLCNVSNYR